MNLDKFQQSEYDLQKRKNVIAAGGSHHLGLADIFKLSLRVFRVRPLRTFLTILGISVGVGTVLFLVSLGYGLQYILIGKLATTEDSLITLEAFYPSESNLNIDSTAIQNIISLEDSGEVSPVAEFSGEVKPETGPSGFLIVKIVKPNYFRLAGVEPDLGQPFTEAEKSLVISNTALKLLNFKEDASSLEKNLNISVFYQNPNDSTTKVSKTPEPLRVAGIVADEFQPPFVFLPEDSLLDKPPFYQRIFVKAKDINRVETLRNTLIEKGFLISARIDLVNQAQKIMAAITIALGVFGVAALIVSAIGMFNTMIIGFLERIFEVGIMKSVGATAQDIRNLFLMESLMMGILGGLGGIGIGIGVGQIFNFGLNILAKYLGGKPVDLFIYPAPFLILIMVISSIVGISAGFWPARRAAKLSPKEAFVKR